MLNYKWYIFFISIFSL